MSCSKQCPLSSDGAKMLILLAVTISIVFVIFLILFLRRKSKKVSLRGKHAIVTGGSSGIGKEVAAHLLRRGASVTLIARNEERLIQACEELKTCITDHQNQELKYFSLDVGGSYEDVKSVVEKATCGVSVQILVNCAGTSVAGRLEDLSIEDIKKMVNINLLGTLQMTHAVLPQMKNNREGSHIVLVGSQASLLGLYGFTAYCSTKFAIRGLAEALEMECKPYNISVTLSLPPDTDTPGFAEEERTKPIATKLISQTAGLYSAEKVASQLVEDTLCKEFFSTVGFDSWLLRTIGAGMAPVTSLLELFSQVLLMGPFRLVGVGYLLWFQKIVQNCMNNQVPTKKTE